MIKALLNIIVLGVLIITPAPEESCHEVCTMGVTATECITVCTTI